MQSIYKMLQWRKQLYKKKIRKMRQFIFKIPDIKSFLNIAWLCINICKKNVAGRGSGYLQWGNERMFKWTPMHISLHKIQCFQLIIMQFMLHVLSKWWILFYKLQLTEDQGRKLFLTDQYKSSVFWSFLKICHFLKAYIYIAWTLSK